MPQHLAHVTFLVKDYEETIAFFTGALGFQLVEDTAMNDGKRWVVVAPPGSGGSTSLLLARASTPEQVIQVGNQTGGRVFLFLHTDDFQRDYDRMQSQGVRFAEPPREEPYGTVVIFYDLYGNKWDLIQPNENN
jgi:catechol 2,3-dioxygenase-like lactoylglutathione lyase family enzyme